MTTSLTQSIETTVRQYPQIYAYTLPPLPDKEGWIKVGETGRKDVNTRILEQVKTAGIDFSNDYILKWAKPAFKADGELFSDRDLHQFFTQHDIEQLRDSNNRLTEWFYFNDHPELSLQLFENFIQDDFSKVQLYDTIPYQLRDEQEKAVEMTLEAIEAGETEFLWNAKPRFGKTLSTYDLIQRMEAKNVLVVTNRPAIANSWFDDFEKFVGRPYLFVSESESLKDRNPLTRREFLEAALTMPEGARQINFISLQDLKGSKYFGGSYEKLDDFHGMHWDILVIDEAHEGVDTLKTDIAFDQIKRDFTLHLSGTPFKAIAKGTFNDNQIYNWSYADEQAAKQDWDEPEIKNPYETLPKLSMFTYKLSDMIIDKVKQGAQLDEDHSVDYMFDLNEFFSTKPNGDFVYEADVLKFLNSLTTHEKFPFSTKELRDELKHTFWLMQRVDSARAMARLLRKHPVFENYKILLAVGSDKDQAELQDVRKAIQENNRTITLSVGQLTTGVTIPEWTGVMMLSNAKSPAFYMQSAFRAQNPWTYQDETGSTFTKKNAYVFDFAPERTLIIFDEFANDLGQTARTTEDRQENIKTLLNFFPVIGEDSEGRMVELNASQVMTIPRTIKAQEVVKSGFMNNFLFANISGIFQSEQAREILELLKEESEGRTRTPVKPEIEISEHVLENLDEDGNVDIPDDTVRDKQDKIFGEAVYKTESVEDSIKKSIENPAKSYGRSIAREVVNDVIVDDFSDNYNLTKRATNQIKRQVEKEIENTFEYERTQFQITKNLIENQANEDIKSLEDDKQIEARRQQLDQDIQAAEKTFQEDITNKIQETVQAEQERIIREQETNHVQSEKKTTEDDVRSRLRGFARTIPSFLMAYGNENTTLSNFDQTIADHVFKEVTGITLDQFRTLRDTYQFFDQVVFDESVQEFLRLRRKLANYFDESQTEDIFDYIPNQETNQIFTPKRVVKMMVDELEEENPGIFNDSTKTFADLYMKSGLYITEIVKRIYEGLRDEMPNDDERIKHILENQVYGFAPTEIIYQIARNYIFGFDERGQNIDDSHIVYLDTLPYAKGDTEKTLEQKCVELFGK